MVITRFNTLVKTNYKIYGPYFFDDLETEHPLTVNYDIYMDMLTTVFPNNTYPDDCFQQDGATVHTSLNTITCHG